MSHRSAALVFLIMFRLGSALTAQQPGSIRGAVRDQEFDTPIAGALVQILELRSGGKARTGDDGNYVFAQVPAGRYTLVFAKEGFVRQVKPDVVVEPGRLVELSVALAGDFTDLEELQVQDLAGLDTSTELGLLELRLQSASLMDSISANLMSRATASDAAAGLRLVAGASLANGKTAVIRGLPDRYVSSQLNGVRLPSADEDKRAVELDQFPTSVIDSIQVSKTFTPDQQGDASGGAVDVRLKGVPNEPFFVKFTGQTSYNTQVTGRDDFLTYQGGGVNFWGKDGGGRAPQLDRLGSSWTGAVGTERDDAPVDSKWSLAVGGKQEIANGVRVGGSANFFYERDSRFWNNGVDDSYWVTTPGAPMSPRTLQGTVQGGDFKTALFDVTQGTEIVKWAGLTAFGLETDRHSINLVWLTTRAAEDAAALFEDTRGKQYFFPGYDPDNPNTPGHSQPDAAPYLRLETLQYTERTTDSLQLTGRHQLPLADEQAVEIDWTLAHSSAELFQPDKRQFGELWIPGRTVGPIVVPASHRPFKPAANFNFGNLQRIFKDIDEQSDEATTDVKFPFAGPGSSQGYVKVGGFYDHLTRKFDQDTFSNFGDNSSFAGPFEEHWSAHFPGENHPITDSQFDVDYDGKIDLAAGYGMIDLPLASGLDLIGGARLESTSISVVNHPESGATWFPPGSLAPTHLNPGDADVAFDQTDVLPAFGIVYKPTDQVTLRASYSQTVARQTFKELTPILQQEFLGGPVFIGNPDLRMSALTNYDLRGDYAPYEGGLLSASWFRKDIKDPIEYVQQVATFDFTTAVNYPKGTLNGWEFEARQALGQFVDGLAGLSVGANATFIDSEVKLPPDEVLAFSQPGIQAPMTERDMTNAPSHLYNAFLTWDLAESRTQLGVFYTVTGDTLIAGAGQSTGNFVPSVYATQYDTLNVSLVQGFGEHFKVALGAKNLTNPEIQEVYRSPYIGADVTKRSHTEGIEYTLSLAFEVKF